MATVDALSFVMGRAHVDAEAEFAGSILDAARPETGCGPKRNAARNGMRRRHTCLQTCGHVTTGPGRNTPPHVLAPAVRLL
ncbi:hypothetical protein [Sphingomonas sp. Leaf37]|uniref:hypothetical protein n=1 Tax=Sphingomonas sp. Leaf37 TaxID=2876552 RepID=UPI001E5C8A19|nr:hypothetical protein [Sphingomonas sp. Leaf37]